MNDYYETYDDPTVQIDNLRLENQRLRRNVSILEDKVLKMKKERDIALDTIVLMKLMVSDERT